MLEGLEAVELKFSKTIKDNIFRIDAEHYRAEYIRVKKILSKHQLDSLSNFVTQTISTGHTPSMKKDEFYGGNIKFIKTNNLRDNYIKPYFEHYLSELGNNEIKRTQLKKDDIIVTIIGATQEIVGRATKITEDILPANINQNIALIRADRNKINPDFINIYLNSYYGKQYLYYLSRQTEQVNLNCEEVGRVQVPIFSNTFQNKIEELVVLSHQKFQESKTLYKQAEELLLKELDLLDFEPSKDKVAIKSFSQSFAESGRLDSEYYQPKYDDILEKIKSYGSGKLSKICNIKDKNYNPKNEILYKYIELSNIGSEGETTGFTNEIGKNLPSRARRKVSLNDVIISSVEGSLDKVALINLSDDNLLCSTGFYVINSEQINSETLLVLFKNKIFQQILKQNCSGTILTAINKDEFYNLEIPLIDSQIQTQIEQKIKESFKLKEKSKQLIEIAKKAVEIAIEKDEHEATSYIEKEGES